MAAFLLNCFSIKEYVLEMSILRNKAAIHYFHYQIICQMIFLINQLLLFLIRAHDQVFRCLVLSDQQSKMWYRLIKSLLWRRYNKLAFSIFDEYLIIRTVIILIIAAESDKQGKTGRYSVDNIILKKQRKAVFCWIDYHIFLSIHFVVDQLNKLRWIASLFQH